MGNWCVVCPQVEKRPLSGEQTRESGKNVCPWPDSLYDLYTKCGSLKQKYLTDPALFCKLYQCQVKRLVD